MSGGTTTQSGTSTSVNQIPQWMSDAGQQNYAYAQQVAEQPLQQYQGQMVADTSPQTQQSWNVAANSGNVGADQYGAATSGYLGALAQNPASVSAGGPTMQVNSPGNAAAVTAGQLSNTDLSSYMNPFTQDVINATLPGMQQANALSQNQQANAANSSNAFGGSRQGIQQGVAQAQGAQNIGQMMATLNSANFAQAQAAATGDINRNLTAATQNQNSQQTDLARQNTDLLANQSANAADLNRSLTAQTTNQTAQQNKINSDIQASQGLTNTGDSMSKNNVANFNMLQSAGASQSMQAQNEINAQMAKFNQAFNYPQQQLGTLESSLGMTPHDTSTSGQTTQQTTTPTDWASIISKGAGAAADIYGMSDKTMKTDITKLGKDPKTGLEMHAFRYKGDPKSYPKVVGPMAQDVQKIAPEAVTPMGKDGKLAIRGYAGGTSMVQPSLAGFTPPSSPLVAKGLVARAPRLSWASAGSNCLRGATAWRQCRSTSPFWHVERHARHGRRFDLGMQMGGGGGISDLRWRRLGRQAEETLGAILAEIRLSQPQLAGRTCRRRKAGGRPAWATRFRASLQERPRFPGFGSARYGAVLSFAGGGGPHSWRGPACRASADRGA